MAKTTTIVMPSPKVEPTLTAQQKQAVNIFFQYVATNNLPAVKAGIISAGGNADATSKMNTSQVVAYLNNGFTQYGRSWLANILQNFQHNPNATDFTTDPQFLAYLTTISTLLSQIYNGGTVTVTNS